MPTTPNNIDDKIVECMQERLQYATDDYASRISALIRDDVIQDVVEATDGCADGFTRGDVCLAIGRALLERMGMEV